MAGLVLLGACDREDDGSISAVPPPTAENTNRLMSAAEQAANDAAARGDAQPPVENHQGEDR